MRHRTSCSPCRSRKIKCKITEDGRPCKRCQSLKLKCSAATQTSPQSISSPPQYAGHVSSFDGADPFPEQSICNELVDMYFDYLHNTQMALFHRATFIADQRQGRAPRVLVAAMLALGARFSTNSCWNNTDPWERGRTWAEYSKFLFLKSWGTVSLVSIQACNLLNTIAFVDGDMTSVILHQSLAVRMLQMLDWPCKLSSDRIQRETEIRVWWNTYMGDSWTCTGAKLPKQLTAHQSFPHPMEEIAFSELGPGTLYVEGSETLEESIQFRMNGMWSQMIPLTEVMVQVSDIQEMTAQNLKTSQEIYDAVDRAASKLDSWLLRLPRGLQNTLENLHRFASKGHGRTFVALHVGYHHHSQLLYYQFLQQSTLRQPPSSSQLSRSGGWQSWHGSVGHASPASGGQSSPAQKSDLARIYANRCKEHAAALSRLFWLANSTPGCECLWPINGHLMVVSSSVHLHTLLFDDNLQQTKLVKTMLEQNFQMLIELRKYWPGLDLSMARLRAFHRVCLRSLETSFVVDNWMLLFLHRYLKPVGDRRHGLHDSHIFASSHDTTTAAAAATTAAAAASDPVAELLADSQEELNASLERDRDWWSSATNGDATGSDILQSFL